MGAQPAYSRYPDRAYERAVERAPRIQVVPGTGPRTAAPALPDSVVFLAKTVAVVLVVLALIGVARVALSLGGRHRVHPGPGTFQQDRRRARPRQPAGGHAKARFPTLRGSRPRRTPWAWRRRSKPPPSIWGKTPWRPTTRATCRCRRACGSRRGPKGSASWRIGRTRLVPHRPAAGRLRAVPPTAPGARAARRRVPPDRLRALWPAASRRPSPPPPTPTGPPCWWPSSRCSRFCSSAGCSICR